jgi:Mn-dependent DtxR family transcriptional regulator
MVHTLRNRRSEPEEVAVSEFHLEVVDTIKEMTSALSGIPPTMAEVALRLGLTKQRIHQIYQILQANGLITYERYQHRSVKVVEEEAS